MHIGHFFQRNSEKNKWAGHIGFTQLVKNSMKIVGFAICFTSTNFKHRLSLDE